MRATNNAGASAYTQGSGNATALAAPTGFTVSAVGTTATLVWDAVAEATAYEYQRKLSTEQAWGVSVEASSPATVSGLAAGLTHDFQVRAKNAGGNSGWVGASVTLVPAAPASVTAGSATTTSIEFSWPASTGATSYGYQYKKAADATWETEQTTNGTSATLTGLDTDTAYDFQVRGTNSAGSSGYTQGSGSTMALAVLAVPTGFTVSAVGTTATLVWDAVAEATAYEYQRKLSTEQAWGASVEASSPATVSGLAAGLTHDFQVRAKNAGGNSGWVGASVTLVPAAPASVTAGSATTTSIEFSWPASTGVRDYIYQYKKASDATWEAEHGTNATYAELTGLDPNTAYDFQVRATNNAGASVYTQGSGSTEALPPPASLRETQATTTTLRFSWRDSEGAVSYGYQYKKTADINWETEQTTPATTATLSGLENATSYDFRVRAMGAINNSAYATDDASTRALSVPPNFAVSLSDITATLTWGAVREATAYEYQRKLSTEQSWGAAVEASSPATVSGLAAGLTQDFQVRAKNAGGASGWASASVTLPPALPASLTAGAVTTTSLEFSWPASAGAETYGYQYKKTADINWEAEQTTPTATVTLSGLDNATAYDFQVRATNSAGSSGYTQGSASTTALAVPTGFAVNITGTTATLVWAEVSEATEYEYRHKHIRVTRWTTSSTSGTTGTIDSLVSGATFDFQVRAKNPGGESGWADSRVTLKPAAPARVTTGTATTTSLAFSWSASVGAMNYGYQYKKTTDGNWETEQTAALTSVTLSGLDQGTSYDFQVRATNSAGSSGYTQGSGSTTTPPPAIPTGLVITTTASGATLDWDDVAGATIYIYRYKKTAERTWGSDVEAISSEAVVSQLENGTSYDFQVWARNTSGAGQTVDRSVFTNPATPESAMQVAATTNSLNFDWADVTGATGYIYQYRERRGDWEPEQTVNVSSVALTSLAPGTYYQFHVKSTNTGGDSLYTETVLGVTLPPTPTELVVTGVSDNSVTIDWSDTPSASQYYYQSKPTAQELWYVRTPTFTVITSNATVERLGDGVAYDIRVRALNESGSSLWAYTEATTTAAPRTRQRASRSPGSAARALR